MRPLISLLTELLRRGSKLQPEPELDVAAAPTTLHSRETTLGLLVALNNCEITVESAVCVHVCAHVCECTCRTCGMESEYPQVFSLQA